MPRCRGAVRARATGHRGMGQTFEVADMLFRVAVRRSLQGACRSGYQGGAQGYAPRGAQPWRVSGP